jgi:ubiquinone biosynthesis protein
MNTLFYALLQQDADATTASLIKLAGSVDAVDAMSLREDLRQFIANHRHTYTTSAPITRLLADILQITAKHRLTLPRGFYLAFKVLATADSVGKKLDPGIDLVKIALPLLRQNQAIELPAGLGGNPPLGTGAQALWQFQDLSSVLRTAFTQLTQGELKLQFEHLGLEDAARCYDRSNSRLASILFIGFLTLGGYGVLCCSILAKLATLKQAIVAGTLLAIVSSSLVLLIQYMTARSLNNDTRHKR